MGADADELRCPHCHAGEPSVWDDVLFHYAHPADGSKLKFCHEPWRERCRRCSASIPSLGASCTSATCDPSYCCTCLRHDQGFGTERHTHACARRHAETRGQIAEDSP